jgi:hypothetical protein
LQWYQHLSASEKCPHPCWGNAAENAVLAQHYKDLFDGKLGFALVKTFKVYPALFGWTINDDAAEFTFRYFDHPRVFILRRFSAAGPR